MNIINNLYFLATVLVATMIYATTREFKGYNLLGALTPFIACIAIFGYLICVICNRLS